MPLAMARPWKHPDSGVYWFRKGVPAHLRTLVGKREEKISLRTKDPAEARLRHGKVASDISARWAALEANGRELTSTVDMPLQQAFSERDAYELARVFYDRYLDEYADNPSKGFWKAELGATLWHDVDYNLLWDAPDLALSQMERREVE